MGWGWDGSGTEVGREWDGSEWVPGQFSLAYALPVKCGKKHETKSTSHESIVGWVGQASSAAVIESATCSVM